MVLYRKYRPQTLQELVGQEQVKKTLIGALVKERLAHAYLFCGPRGTGKTSTARVLAKLVNCTKVKKQTGEPCNKCQTCLSITDGSNLDLIEIDAASNRGIDDIRSLRETIKLSPTSERKKVYIIDEVHMLTTEAFNALLKTLEEPPEHALFILATTEPQKIPPTIISRVQKLDFQMAQEDDLQKALQKIAKSEGINVETQALFLIAKKAAGSFRDGVKLLDQLSSLEEITQAQVEKALGTGDFAGLIDLADLIIQKQAADALKTLISQLDSGIGAKELNVGLLDLLRQVLFVKNNLGDQLLKPNLLGADYQKIKELAQKLELSEVIRLIDIFQKSLESLKYTTILSLPLEVAVIESSMPQTNVFSARVDDPDSVKIESNAQSSPVLPEPAIPTNSDDIQKIKDKWNYILETIRPHNYSLEALLRSVRILECGERKLLIEVPYSFHQRILAAPKSRDLLESVLSDVLGRNIKVSTVLGQRPVRADEIANLEIAQDDEIIRVAAEIFNSDSVN